MFCRRPGGAGRALCYKHRKYQIIPQAKHQHQISIHIHSYIDTSCLSLFPNVISKTIRKIQLAGGSFLFTKWQHTLPAGGYRYGGAYGLNLNTGYNPNDRNPHFYRREIIKSHKEIPCCYGTQRFVIVFTEIQYRTAFYPI